MQNLEIIYEQKYKNNVFFNRKVNLELGKSILYGPKQAGKTSLIIDFIKNNKKLNILYIDFNDERISRNIYTNLEQFIKVKNINTLIIENFDFQTTLPNIDNIILTSYSKKVLKNFKSQILLPLDFEEFILFDRKSHNVENTFTNYLNRGNFPKNAQEIGRASCRERVYAPV